MSESQNIEYKQSWRDEYLKWICGFANAQGGKLYIGMNDQGEAVGLINSKRLLEDIPNKIVNYLGIVTDINLIEVDEKEVVEIDVPISSVPISFRGTYYYRSGAHITRTKRNCFATLSPEKIRENMGRPTLYAWYTR
jgi:ATP-dependent DNA helicase RecG